MKQFFVLLMAVGILGAVGCKQQPGADLLKSEDFQKALQEKLILAKNGDVIELPEGRFQLTKPLLLEGLDDITIRGQGIDKTILSFKGQTEGAEGIFVSNMKNVIMEDFTVEDALGDNFKAKGCDGVVYRKLKSTWTGGAKETNGAYGFYPVECRNVLIEDCEVSFCSDAGVYVGQSTNVVVRRNYAHQNVAGIEIENCINSDVYDNLSENNTGGILVFDLPKLFQANGRNARVFNNRIINNNHKNFAAPGNIVAIIPPGSGIIILATDSVEIYDNIIEDHKTVGIAVVSYAITEKPVDDTTYGPHSNSIFIRNNTFQNSKKIPDLSTDMGKLLSLAFRKPVDILYDNINDPALYNAEGHLPDDKKLCIRENSGVKTFGNLNGWKAKSLTDLVSLADTDITKFDCAHGPMPGARTPVSGN